MDMIKKRAAMRGQSGFTLVELLVAVAILAVLAGTAVFAVGSLTDNATTAACDTEAKTVKTAAAAYKVDAGVDATSVSDLTGATPPLLDQTPKGTYTFSGGVPTQTACA